MIDVSHVFIHTCEKLLLAQICIEKIYMFCVANLFIDTVAKLILVQVSIE